MKSIEKMKFSFLPTFFFCFFLNPLLNPFSHAKKNKTLRPSIQIGKAQVKQSTLALFPPLYTGKALHTPYIKIKKELFQIIYNNLSVSSLFKLIAKKDLVKLSDFIGSVYSSYPPPSNEVAYKKLLEKKIDFMIQGNLFVNSKNQLTLKMFFYSTSHKKILFSRSYQVPLRFYEKIGHAFSDDILQALTGKRSFFQTKIVTTRWKKRKKRKKEIFILDWDGRNIQKISNHKSISISPTWSKDGKFIAYTSFLFHKRRKTRNADLLLYSLFTNETFILHSGRGLNSGAAFHPDGKSLFFTSSRRGNPDIYKINFHQALTKQNKLSGGPKFNQKLDQKYSKRKKRIPLKQITRGPYSAMNVEPALSPDGKKIAFSSDRGGSPTIYIKDLNGKNLKKLVSVGRYNASPAWSPDGSKIVFAGYSKGHFDIFIIQSDGSGLTRLTSARKANGRFSNNEDPSFSPDGKRILFTSDRSGNKQLYIIQPDGEDERRITFDQWNYERPKWSPLF